MNHPNFWLQYPHFVGFALLVALACFPRVSTFFMFIVSGLSGGILWWLGWIFTPHLLVAFLSIPYYDQNPLLVICAWIIAIAGTFGESAAVRSNKRSRNVHRNWS